MESIKKNKILVSIFLIVFAVFIYFFFFNNSSTATQSVGVSGMPGTPGLGGGIDNGAGSGSQSDIVGTLEKINTVNIDNTLFSDSSWLSLKDFSQPISNNVPGKNDLFAPVGQLYSAQPVTQNTTVKQ
jgi:hypothetical protein